MKGTDKDLAAHFTIIKSRGRCLFGEVINDVFAAVPKADYLDSIRNDIASAKEDILENSMYIILNLARVLAYMRDGFILSKKEGGDWAIQELPVKYQSLIENALSEYTDGVQVSYNPDLLKDFADYMLNQIKTFSLR